MASDILRDADYFATAEFKFHPTRRFRADFHVRVPMIENKECLVEIEGITMYGKNIGRHQSPKGFTNDCEKYNLMTLAGYTYFRFTKSMVKSGQMIRALD